MMCTADIRQKRGQRKRKRWREREIGGKQREHSPKTDFFSVNKK